MKYIIIFVSAMLFIGCGGGSDSTQASTTTETYDVSVERGPVLGAYVVDSNALRAYFVSNGTYRFTKTPTYPLNVYGGYIDVNRDGVLDIGDTSLAFPLSIKEQGRNKLTVVTTLVQNLDIKNELQNVYALSDDELYTLTPSTSFEVSAISNEVFKYCIDNNVSIEDINVSIMQTLRTSIQAKITANKLSGNTLLSIITQDEIDLVNDLNITLTDLNITLGDANTEITNSAVLNKDVSGLVNSIAASILTQSQIDDLIFMYQEEKVARDVYIKMGEKWNLNVFTYISKAEQMHMDSVKSLLIKYNIAVPVLSDTVGLFDLTSLQVMYDALIIKGNVSSNEALKVGKEIEETDIHDLETKIVGAPADIKIVYQNLLKGSYNHLNAFSKQIR